MRTSTARVVQLVLLILLALLVLTPLLWLVSTSLKGPAEDIFSSPPALLPAQPSLPWALHPPSGLQQLSSSFSLDWRLVAAGSACRLFRF